LVILTLLSFAGCSAGPTETRDDAFTVGGAPRLVVNSENGSIEVDAGPDNEVSVQATLRGVDRIDYDVSQSGDTITVDVRIERAWWMFSSAGVDVSITAPAGTELDLETSNGAVELYGIHGSASARTSNGRVAIENASGDFEARTSNGRIDVDGFEGTLYLRTSNGKVDLREVNGEVDVDTSNGEIWYSGNMTPGGRNRLVSSNGDVDVELRGTPSVVLDAETSNGRVTSELPVLATVTDKDRLVGKIGDGETDLYVRTSNGDITVK
jgi:DUF4097 and DUF4098 domain-containing protein YvlB